MHGYILGTLNRTDESLQEDKLTVELDPFARPGLMATHCCAPSLRRRLEGIHPAIRSSPRLRKSFTVSLGDLCLQGDYKQAIEQWKKVLTIEATLILLPG